MPAPKLNVLFVVIDQLRADAVFGPLAAHVPTPNLDRLKAEGTSFHTHVTVTAPCGPARASLLTGLYAMNHRSIRNGTPLGRHHTNLALEARKVGHEPLLFGYTDAQQDPTDRDPEDPDLATYENCLPGFRELVEMRFETAYEWTAFLAREGYHLPRPLPERLFDLYRPNSLAEKPEIRDPAIYRAEHSDTAYLTDRTLAHLAVRTDRPWFAHVTYIRPHPPFVAPAPFNRLIEPAELPGPVTATPAHPFVSAWFSEPSQKKMIWDFDGRCDALTPEQVADIRAVYLGLLAEVDQHLGRLLDFLDETGQADRTLVVVTADHAEMLGDHGMWGKDNVFDGAFRIPLLIRGPGVAAGRVVTAPTESVDVAPTILGQIGAAVPPAMDGRPLTPFLTGDGTPPADWRTAAFMEVDFASPGRPTRFQNALGLSVTAANAAILREAKWKYVHFNGGVPPLLFDLETDPGETVNLADDPAFASERLRLASAMLDRRMSRAFRGLTEWRPAAAE